MEGQRTRREMPPAKVAGWETARAGERGKMEEDRESQVSLEGVRA